MQGTQDKTPAVQESQVFHCKCPVQEGFTATVVTQGTSGSHLTNGSDTVS